MLEETNKRCTQRNKPEECKRLLFTIYLTLHLFTCQSGFVPFCK